MPCTKQVLTTWWGIAGSAGPEADGCLRTYRSNDQRNLVSRTPATTVKWKVAAKIVGKQIIGLAEGNDKPNAKQQFWMKVKDDGAITIDDGTGRVNGDYGMAEAGDVLQIEYATWAVSFKRNGEVLHEKVYEIDEGVDLYAYAQLKDGASEMCRISYHGCRALSNERERACIVSGDPHVHQFDGARYDPFFAPGHWWLVRSEFNAFSVQGQYAACGRKWGGWQSSRHKGMPRTCLTAVAFGGRLLRTTLNDGTSVENTLVIKPPCDWDWERQSCRSGSSPNGAPLVYWNGQQITKLDDIDSVITVRHKLSHHMLTTFHLAQGGRWIGHIHIDLPSGITAEMGFNFELPESQYRPTISWVKTNMRQDVLGFQQCGHCGNNNGNLVDDALYNTEGFLHSNLKFEQFNDQMQITQLGVPAICDPAVHCSDRLIDEAILLRVTSTDHSQRRSTNMYFNFDWPDGKPKETSRVVLTQCRQGQAVWTGRVIMWANKAGGSTGNAHGRREWQARTNQWQTGDYLTSDHECPSVEDLEKNPGANCVENPAGVKVALDDCPTELLEQARARCSEAFKQVTLSDKHFADEEFGNCLMDECLMPGGFAEEEAEEAKQIADEVPATVADDSFEYVSDTDTFKYVTEVEGWQVSSTGIVSIRSGNPSWQGTIAAHGNYFLGLQQRGTWAQQVLSVVPGGAYKIRYSIARRNHYHAPQVEVIVDARRISQYTPPSHVFQQKSHNVEATSANLALTFHNNGHSGDRTVFLDAVSVTREFGLTKAPSFETASSTRNWQYVNAIEHWQVGGHVVVIKSDDRDWGQTFSAHGSYHLGCQLTGSWVAQDVDGLVPGRTYELSYHIGSRRHYGHNVRVRVLVGGAEITSSYTPSWDRYLQKKTHTFVAADSTVQIKFENVSPHGDNTFFLDAVSVEEKEA
eukprot:TRINITY_DN1418_c0_g1_i13.p1 TRINITY_DN1418_c0_g1~~TRINITY_DN1418_c0_g1_i13.p1  ORF type:complete len:920 (-),score=153.52 TRINITY_DN1418_c0_g1_i13:190-2949(-)